MTDDEGGRRPAGRGRRLRELERGQVIVIFALGVVAILGFASLGFDTGRFYSERRYLQNATDAGVFAAASALTRGASEADAKAEAYAVTARNILNSPTGSGVTAPADPPIYAAGHSGDPQYLVSGILIANGDIRVAVRGYTDWTLGRALGLTQVPIIAQSRGRLDGSMLPIAVREFVYPPGPTSGAAYPCSNVGPHDFQALLATAATSCLGTTTDASARTPASPGMAFDSNNANNDPEHHGPIQTFIGVNAKANNGADFRGFIALDIRNFAFNGSQIYYNGITAGTQATTIRDVEGAYVKRGYPGPNFPSVVSPPDPNLQVATMDGNSSGTVLDIITKYLSPGDEFMAPTYNGSVMTIPDFTLTVPNTITIGNTQNNDNGATLNALGSNEFAGIVDITAFKDWGDAQNPYGGTLQNFTFSPNSFAPSTSSGTTVNFATFRTSAAPTGVYTVWVKGHSGSPYLTDHYYPVGVKIGTVNRDFNASIGGLQVLSPTLGGQGSITFTVSTPNSNASYFNGTVALAVEGGASTNGALPAGIGARTLSTSSIQLNKGTSTTVTLTVNAGSLTQGVYDLTLAIWGTNGDGQKVTRLYPFTLGVATSSNQKNYVDISGFAVFRVTRTTSNTMDGYAISDKYPSQYDPRLKRGMIVRIVGW